MVRGKVVVVGIADGKKENLTIKAYESIMSSDIVYLQSGLIPLVCEIEKDFKTFDDVYEAAEDFDALKIDIAEKIQQTLQCEDIVFCVLGDVSQNEIAVAVVDKLIQNNVEVEIIQGLACGLDAVSGATLCGGINPIGIKAVAGYSFDIQEVTGEGVLIYEIDSEYLASDIKLKLLRFYPDDKKIYIYDGEKSSSVLLEELDRLDGYGYAFSAYISPSKLEERCGFGFLDLLQIAAQLRSENGCPWDKKQTHDSLKKFLIEESYEVFDAIKEDDMDMLYDELGDVLLQIALHGQIAKEYSEFDTIDVTTAVCSKMINRHPHVFASVKVDGADDVAQNWEMIKEKEKGINTYSDNLKDVPKFMPSLMRSQKVQKRAAACGFDWENYKLPLAKVREELEELVEDIEAGKDTSVEMGDLLFAVTNLARHLKLDSEIVLYNGIEKFVDRFEKMEKWVISDEKSMDQLTLNEMDEYWEKCKK